MTSKLCVRYQRIFMHQQ